MRRRWTGGRQVAEINAVIKDQLRFPPQSGQIPEYLPLGLWQLFLVPSQEISLKSCHRARSVRFRTTVAFVQLDRKSECASPRLDHPNSESLVRPKAPASTYWNVGPAARCGANGIDSLPRRGQRRQAVGGNKILPARNGTSAVKKPAVRHPRLRGRDSSSAWGHEDAVRAQPAHARANGCKRRAEPLPRRRVRRAGGLRPSLTRQDERICNFVGFPRCSGLAAGLELLQHQLFDPE